VTGAGAEGLAVELQPMATIVAAALAKTSADLAGIDDLHDVRDSSRYNRADLPPEKATWQGGKPLL
jgi:hypothetical protein